MEYKKNNKYRNMLTTISITKLIVIFYFFSKYIIYILRSKDTSNYFSRVNDYFFIIALVLLIGILFWGFVCVYLYESKKKTIELIIEDSIFMLILTIIMMYHTNYKESAQILYILSVISITISFGKKYGIYTAIISSLSIIAVDFNNLLNLGKDIYFESDVIMSFLFIIVSWILGEYKKIESLQKNELKSELNEQLRKYSRIDYMLLKNEDSFNLLIEQSDYAIVVHSDNNILYLNKKTLELMGLESFEQVKRESFLDFIKIRDRENTERLFSIILNKQLSDVTNIEDLVTKDGRHITIKSTSTYFNYGKIPAIVTIIRDISSEMQVKQLKADVEKNAKLLNESQEHNKFITEFFSNISHELKTPLNIIFSAIHMLNIYNEKNDEEFILKRKEYLNSMKQNTYRLIKLINNILDITKLDYGFVKPKLKNGNIVYTIEELTMSVVPYAESKKIELIFDTDIEEKIIAFDEDKIERIILNLLSNALKFTDEGGQIFVNIFDKGDILKVSVKDTGIGIPEDKINVVFDRFIQVDKALNRNREGTGIGLSIVKSFVMLHGGDIILKSKLGEGSEFIFTLPVKQIDEEYAPEQIKDDVSERVNLELSDIASANMNNKTEI